MVMSTGIRNGVHCDCGCDWRLCLGSGGIAPQDDVRQRRASVRAAACRSDAAHTVAGAQPGYFGIVIYFRRGGSAVCGSVVLIGLVSWLWHGASWLVDIGATKKY